ncbi:hypothetical protein G7048_26320 (plasmid) [Diaphorobacter sp. HDW4B]|uniref:hypothetical protein n=1 Tax=Diaphorobacter sp. HDW4B TaxID=2714925 RepID=UPI00140BAB47|nr:hypothetical protein [Diaphorobacter sp. HDW4B]QIL74008.1 hypothetical protein G7048_26320 [Diaphorobacter sp. HDW4B]
MRMMTTDNSELMEVSSVRAEGGKVIVSGTIMGAMPVQAVLSGTELRKGYSMVSFGTLWQIFKIFLSGKGA